MYNEGWVWVKLGSRVRFRMWVRFRLGLGEGLGLGTLASVFLSTKWSIESLTGSRDLRCATGFGRATSMPGLALSLSPAQPPGPLKQDRGRVGVYLLFSLKSPPMGF